MKYRGLDPRTRPLRWGLFLLLVGVVLVATGGDALATISRWLEQERDRLPWYATRLFALLSYLAITTSVLYGLLLSTGILDAVAHRTVSFMLHQDLSAIGLGLALVHAALLTIDNSVPYTLVEIVLPFVGPYRPVWVGIGQVSLYLAAAVYFSFNFRRRIGQRAWRLLHYLTLLAFAGATAHGLMAGTDTDAPWAFCGYVTASASVAFLTGYRIVLAAAGRVTRGTGPVAGAAGRSPTRLAVARPEREDMPAA